MDWSFDAWPAIEPLWYEGAARQEPWDTMEYHLDLGCGTLKKGRIGIDHYAAPGVNIVMDLDEGWVHSLAKAPGEDAPPPEVLTHSWRTTLLRCGRGLPFKDSTIESVITHHCLEHVGEGFIPLMDDIYRVLKPDGILRVIVPLFPSRTAVEDPDHRRYFMDGTFESFCGHLGSDDNPTGCWLDSFSVPYTRARFHMLDKDITPPVPAEERWGPNDARELRVALQAVK
jgi:SAM-dependent methyltransferase